MAAHVLTGSRQVQCRRQKSSSSVRLDELPDVVQVLENDPLCPHEEPPTQGSVQIAIASPKLRA